jgi:hypothetical protein
MTIRAQGLKTGVRTVVLYLHFVISMDVKSGTLGDNEWTTLKREEITGSLGKT